MNNHMHSRSTVYGAQESPGAVRLWQRGGRWRSTKLQRALFVLIGIASTLLLIGCPGSDDDDDGGGDSETFAVGFRARRFENVMPIVNDKAIEFPGGVMGTAGGAGDGGRLSVTGFDTCDENGCSGTFTLTDLENPDNEGDDISAEGDSGGETSCFFLFRDADIQPQDSQIDCFTCDLEVVEENCVVEEGEETQCTVRWLLAGTPSLETAPEDAAASVPFTVTLTLEDGDVIAILAGGNVVLVPEIDEDAN